MYIIVVYVESDEADEIDEAETNLFGVVVIEIDELEVMDEIELMLKFSMKH